MTSTTFFIIFIPILSLILLAVNLLLAPHNPYQEKDSVFECGFHSFLGQNRTQFSVSFFIFGLLFLLFDLEILLVYPYSVSGYNNDIYGLAIMMIFFVLLTLGFIFELGKNALTIDSKQTVAYHGSDSPTGIVYLVDVKDTILPETILKSGIFWGGIRALSLKINRVRTILFSRSYLNYLTSKLLTWKTFFIVVFSMVIGNIVRYIAIKYGTDIPLQSYPLLFHPILFSSATGISSFLSLTSKITIETIFNLFEEKKLVMMPSEPYFLSKTPEINTALKMDSHSDGISSNNPIEPSEKKLEEIVASIDFNKLDSLMNELKTNINNANEKRLIDIQDEITNQMKVLNGLSSKALETIVPNHIKLVTKFIHLENKGFSDVGTEIEKIVDIMRKDRKSPSESLLDSDPEKYFKDKIKFVNRVKQDNNEQYKIIKNYVKNTAFLTSSEKQEYFTKLNQLKKGASQVADADNSILKKQLENSAILTELKKKLNK